MNAEVMRYPKGPIAYSLVGRSTGLMSGLRKCSAAMTTTKYPVPKAATVAKITNCVRAFGLDPVSACIDASSFTRSFSSA
jgi:hypothetical protein